MNKLEQTNEEQNTAESKQNQTTSPASQDKPKIKKIANRKIILIVISVVLITIISSSSIFYATRIKSNQSGNNNSQNNSQVVATKKVIDKLSQNSDSSTQVLTQEVAAKLRVKELTNLEFDQYKVAKNDISSEIKSQAANLNTPVTEKTPEMNFAKPQSIAGSSELISKVVTPSSNSISYYEIENSSDTSTNKDFLKLLNIDNSKPHTVKNWINANYSQYVYEQEGKIMSVSVNTPEFSANYSGGKYALKYIYENKAYFAGFTTRTPELDFLLRIIEKDANLVNKGVQTVNGQELNVFESTLPDYTTMDTPASKEQNEIGKTIAPANPKVPKTVERYFTTKNNLTLVKIEIVEDGKIVNTQTYKSSKIFEGVDVKKEINENIFKDNNIELREYNDKDFVEKTKLTKAVNKGYKIPLSPFYTTQYILSSDNNYFSGVYRNEEEIPDTFSYRSDYWGTFSRPDASNYMDATVRYSVSGGYAADEGRQFSVEIYDQMPPEDQISLYVNNGEYYTYKDAKLVISINGQKFNCIKSTSVADKVYPAASSYSCLVKYDEKYYYIFSNKLEDLLTLELKDSSFVSTVEDYFIKVNNYRGYFNSINLNNIESRNLPLPGSLKSIAGLVAKGATEVTVDKGIDKNDVYDFVKNKMDAQTAFYLKFNAVTLDYATRLLQTSNEQVEYEYVTYRVLDLDFQSATSELKNYFKDNKNFKLSTVEIGGVKYDTIDSIMSYNNDIANPNVNKEIRGMLIKAGDKSALVDISLANKNSSKLPLIVKTLIDSSPNKGLQEIIKETAEDNSKF